MISKSSAASSSPGSLSSTVLATSSRVANSSSRVGGVMPSFSGTIATTTRFSWLFQLRARAATSSSVMPSSRARESATAASTDAGVLPDRKWLMYALA